MASRARLESAMAACGVEAGMRKGMMLALTAAPVPNPSALPLPLAPCRPAPSPPPRLMLCMLAARGIRGVKDRW